MLINALTHSDYLLNICLTFCYLTFYNFFYNCFVKLAFVSIYLSNGVFLQANFKFFIIFSKNEKQKV
uniref:Uncharacterized protein n=1 Tax=Panagrolaimus sp. PS1159 TaxID=55785 RepID=A0AC35FEK9_9BILA